MSGLFIAVEGPKSVGKTSLLASVRQQLEPGTCTFTKEPTHQFDLGVEQREGGLALARLIADDRARHVAETVAPRRQRGGAVVSDRYILSSYVFHCLDGVDQSVVAELNVGFPLPDILVVLLCAPETLQRRRATVATGSRFSTTLDVNEELLAYVEYADVVRPASGDIRFLYNERMADHERIASALADEIRSGGV